MKIKANMLLITLFLLLMSSLSALLVTAYIRNLIKLSSSFHDYYKGYYVANAGLELSLVKTNGSTRGYGFADAVVSGSTTVKNNFPGSLINFSSTILTSSLTLGDTNTTTSQPLCGPTSTSNSTGGWYMLAPGGCAPIIFLEDRDQQYFSGKEGKLLPIEGSNLQVVGNAQVPTAYPSPVVYATTGFTALVTQLNNDLSFKDGSSTGFTISRMINVSPGIYRTPGADLFSTMGLSPISSNNTRYIVMIANTTNTTGYYCMYGGNPTPTQYITISSLGQYSNTKVSLQGIRKAGLPADFCYTAISQN